MRAFKDKKDALRKVTEAYLRARPQWFLDDRIQELIGDAPDLTDDELSQLGSKIFKGASIAKLVAEGRE